MRIFMLTQTVFMDLDRMTTMPQILTLTRDEGTGKKKVTVAEGWVLAVPQDGANPTYVRSDYPPNEAPIDLQAIIDRIVRATWNGVEEAIVRIVPAPVAAPNNASTQPFN